MPAPFHSPFPPMGTVHRVRLVRSLLDTFPGTLGPWPEVPCLGLRRWVLGAERELEGTLGGMGTGGPPGVGGHMLSATGLDGFPGELSFFFFFFSG